MFRQSSVANGRGNLMKPAGVITKPRAKNLMNFGLEDYADSLAKQRFHLGSGGSRRKIFGDFRTSARCR